MKSETAPNPYEPPTSAETALRGQVRFGQWVSIIVLTIIASAVVFWLASVIVLGIYWLIMHNSKPPLAVESVIVVVVAVPAILSVAVGWWVGRYVYQEVSRQDSVSSEAPGGVKPNAASTMLRNRNGN